MSRLFEKFRGDILGLAWAAVAVFMALSLGSYNPMDPSFNSMGEVGRPHNLCGYFGSFLADLFYQGFGLTAWVLVLGGLRLAYLYFSEEEPKHLSRRWLLDAALLLVASSLLSLHFKDVHFYHGHLSMGGWIGTAIVHYSSKALNPVGLGLILWTAFIGLFILITERSVLELFAWPRQLIGAKFFSLAAVIGPFKALFSKLSAPRLPRIERKEKKAQRFEPPAAAESSPRFFKIQNDVSADFADDEDGHSPVPDFSSDTDVMDEEDKTPISGFFSQAKKQAPKKRKLAVKVPRRIENWRLPKLSMLADPPSSRGRLDEKEIKAKARLLVEKLAQFSVRGEVVGIKPGPAVTMFEFKPAVDVKISKITELADDLSLALSSESVRIIAPIPGRDVVGIETSNSQRESVYLKDILENEDFWNQECKLPTALGRKADGEPRIVDLRKMPHLLVAGTTGSGKSVFVVSMLTGLLFRHSPKTLKLILVDPKQVDLAAFSDLPHLIMPPIREPKKAVGALRWAIREMEKRYRSMSKFGARGIEAFNEIVEDFSEKQKDEHLQAQAEFESPYHPDAYYFTPQPYIAIFVEEFGDLMAVDKVNVEQAVVRLAQMARACGIHLVLAMQSPRKDVVTGLIKTNIPGRISFKVASKMDSRIILDEGGAERLLARGDMLFVAPGISKPERHHGPYLTEEEIARVVQEWKEQGEPEYDEAAMRAIEGSGGGFSFDGPGSSGSDEDGFDDGIKDERYDEVLAYVASLKEVSASLLQRKFRLGYPRAARMIEIFETEGVVGPANGSKPRQVLIRELPR